MRCGLRLGLLLFYCCSGCSLDTKPLVGASNSVTTGPHEESAVSRAPSLAQTERGSRFRDAGTTDAAEPTQTGSGKAVDAAMPQDAGAPEPPPKNTNPAPMKMEAIGGAGAVAAAAGAGGAVAAGSSASGSGGAAGMPQAGAPAPTTTTKQALIAVLMERASMNGADALVTRALISQLDSPFPSNSATLRLLLGNAITSFGCPSQMNAKQCAVICDFVGDSCLTCVADQECRGQMVLVCPNALTACLQ
jgi:hypothetical protein